MGYRLSIPINVIHNEAREPLLNLRFDYLASKYMFKAFSLRYNPVIQSLKLLQDLAYNCKRKIKLIKKVPFFPKYLMYKYSKFSMYRSISELIYLPSCSSLSHLQAFLS